MARPTAIASYQNPMNTYQVCPVPRETFSPCILFMRTLKSADLLLYRQEDFLLTLSIVHLSPLSSNI